jgi:hypothetical protein
MNGNWGNCNCPLYYLMPYERWFAARALAQQSADRSERVAKARLRYGPAGMRFYAATLANTALGISVTSLTFVVLIVSLAWHPLARAAVWVLVAGAAFFAVALSRGVQSEWLGREHRRSGNQDDDL